MSVSAEEELRRGRGKREQGRGNRDSPATLSLDQWSTSSGDEDVLLNVSALDARRETNRGSEGSVAQGGLGDTGSSLLHCSSDRGG